MLIATFGRTTGWVGKTITYGREVFTLEGHGRITAADVLAYSEQGHLVWAYDGLREWVEERAAAQNALDEAIAADEAAVSEYHRMVRACLRSQKRWQELLKSVARSKDADDLCLLRAGAQEIHDPDFPPNGKDAGPVIGPPIDDLVVRINARLRKLEGRRP